MTRGQQSGAEKTSELTWEKLAEIVGEADRFRGLELYLGRMTNPADLRSGGVALADLVHQLPEADQDRLRQSFIAMLQSIQHVVKSEVLNGRRTTVTRAKYVETKVGPTYRLSGTYQPETGGERQQFECWMPGSSRGPVYRFFERRPHDAYPVEVCFRKEAHPTDPDKEMWTVDLLAPEAGPRQTNGAIPF